MTNKETIETIKIAISEVEWNYPMDYSVAFETAMEALEKQIPKNPIYSGGHEFICPNCKRFIRKNVMIPCCKWCGQALDWRETE